MSSSSSLFPSGTFHTQRSVQEATKNADLSAVVVQELETVTFVQIAMYKLTSETIVNALVKAAKRGCRMELLLYKEEKKNKTNAKLIKDAAPNSSNISVKFWSENKLHLKFAIFTHAADANDNVLMRVHVGSANYSKGIHENQDGILIVDNKSTVQSVQKEFQEYFKIAE